jgi:hypothetical protein
MILTIIILILFALFWVAELVAHVTRYRYGQTLSAKIWMYEASRKYGTAVRVTVGALVALLFTHLEFHLP